MFYGHPTVFAQPAIDAAIKAKQKGYYIKVLPGISAEDCLFADLLIDPSSSGCHSFDATDFLIRERRADPSSHLILWQVGIIGVLKQKRKHNNTKGAIILLNYLKNTYPENHMITLYEAAIYPHFDPKIKKLKLKNLPTAKFSSISTLYIPPLDKSPINYKILSDLDIKMKDIK